MIQPAEQLNNLHFEHLIWHNELENILIELKIYDQRIKSLQKAGISAEMEMKLKTYSKRFLDVSNRIKNWKLMIGKHEYRILDMAKMDGAIRLMDDAQHEEVRKQMQWLRKSLLELKEGFQYFLISQMNVN